MKKRVLLALTMAMATAAMFISPAVADVVGLPALVASATSNNTQRPTGSGNSVQTPKPVPVVQQASVTKADGTKISSTVPMNTSTLGGVPVALTTPQGAVLESAGIQQGETLVPTLSMGVGPEATKALTDATMAAGAKMALPFDITMYVQGRNAEDNRVRELSAPVTFVVQTPAYDADGKAIDKNAVDFAILRGHEGVVTLLPDLDDDPNTVTFATDRFSAYAIIYGEKGSFNLTAKDSVPKTGDQLPTAVPVTVTVCLAAVAVTMVALNKKKRA